MNELQIIDEHILIREMCGYDIIDKIDVLDIPQVIQFLNICNNYLKMKNILNR